jgi:hypothetical protein
MPGQFSVEINRVILESEQYAKLEINAFANFSCKYTARLYPRLALMAQRHPSMHTPWIIKPEELAELIGYKHKKFHFGNFAARCLDPVRSDINIHVDRFSMSWNAKRGTGRGSPVTHIVFTTNTIQKVDRIPLAETQKRPLDADGFNKLNDALHEGPNWHLYMPSAGLVRAASMRTGYTPVQLVALWREALNLITQDASITVPHTPLRGYQINEIGCKDGPGAAFEKWAKALAHIQAYRPPKESNTPSGITVIKYKDVPPSERTNQVQESLNLSPTDAFAHCDIEHPAWQVVVAALSDDQYLGLHSAFAVLKLPVAGGDDQQEFVAKLTRIIADVGPADLAYDVAKLATETCQKIRGRSKGSSNQRAAAA